MNETKSLTPYQKLQGLITNQSHLDTLKRACAKYVTPDRLAQVALTAAIREPKIADCTPASVLNCLRKCAILGIEPDGRNAHLIPYGNELTLQLDWKGLVMLGIRAGARMIRSEEVCENDHFRWAYGANGLEVCHEIDIKQPRGEPVGYYAVAKLESGELDGELMSLDEVVEVKERYSQDSPAWRKSPKEMRKKTPLKRLMKRLPISPEIDAIVGEEDGFINVESSVESVPAPRPSLPPTRSQAPAQPPTPPKAAQAAAPSDPPKRGRGRPPGRRTLVEEPEPAQEPPADPQVEDPVDQENKPEGELTQPQSEQEWPPDDSVKPEHRIWRLIQEAGWTFQDFKRACLTWPQFDNLTNANSWHDLEEPEALAAIKVSRAIFLRMDDQSKGS